ncbi:uncharacterized protein LOC141702053 [Apium graveolens]|uniref:Uncharacterized protein n=1 Tax=Apium graveolens TaxID=4045 RepID=A0A6L5B9N7_APIGR|nr:hypothetical protein AG4045_000064 [Apium graveolens]
MSTVGEIEASPTTGFETSDEPSPLLTSQNSDQKSPEVEINLYKQGRGPIAVFKASLGGYEQDQLEVVEILDKYGFKAIYAYNSVSGRGVPIRFNPKNGRSLLPYTDGAVISVDGEPKDSVINPITKILVGVAFMTIVIVFVVRESPQWAQKFNFSGGSIPPWVLALVVIVFTRLSKRTKNFLKQRGW